MLILAARQWLNLLPFLRFVWLTTCPQSLFQKVGALGSALKLLHICARPHAFSVNAKHFWLASKLYIIPCSPCDESDIKILHDSQRLVLAKLICPCLLILNAMVLLHWLEYLHSKLCHLVPPGFRFCGHWDFLCIKLNVFSWSLVQQLWWSGWKSHRLASLHAAW